MPDDQVTSTSDPSERVNVRNQLGGVSSVQRRQLDAQADTLSEETPTEEASRLRQDRLVREHDTIGSRALAALGGATDALTLGFANPWQDDREFHPNYSGVGKAAGLAATLLVPGAGEENVAHVGLEGIEGAADLARAGEAASTVTRGSRAARAIGSAVERTPLGLTSRLAERAGGLIEGTGLGSRIARTTLEGTTAGGAIGLGTELSHQLLDSDARFSGENLLGSTLEGALVGGGIGAVGSAISEGVSSLPGVARRLLGRVESGGTRGMSAETFSEASARRAPTPYSEEADLATRPPLGPMLNPRNATLLDGVTSRTKDLESLGRTLESLSDAPAIAGQAGLTAHLINEAQGSVETELAGLKSLSHFEDAPLARLAELGHANDLIGARLSRVTDRLPSRWTDAEQRAQSIIDRDRALEALDKRRAAGIPVSQAEEDAARYSVQLSSGRPAGAMEEVAGSLVGNAARALVSKLPGGKLLSSGLGAAGGVGIAEHVISHGVSGLVGGVALPLAAGGIAAKAVQLAFRDPHVGGLIAADAASVLNSTGVLRGSDRPSSRDPRQALRELADRSRLITPVQAGAAAVASLSHVAGSSPLSLSEAGQAATKRHAQLLAILDRLDPRAMNQGQRLMGRALPSAQSAREAAEFVRMAASPTNFIVAALQGRLTPTMMAKAERLWPATVMRARAELTSQLSGSVVNRMSPARLSSVETILGRQLLEGSARSAAYSSVLSASVTRSRQSSQVGPPSRPPGPSAVGKTTTAAQRASLPGGR